MEDETLEAQDDELDEFEESEEDEGEDSPDPYDEFYDSLEGEDEDGEKPKAPPADRLQVTLEQTERRLKKLQEKKDDVSPSEYQEVGELMRRLPAMRERAAENEAARAFAKITTEALPEKTLDAEEAAVKAHRALSEARAAWKKADLLGTAFEKRVARRAVEVAKDATLAAYREAGAHRAEQERRAYYEKNEDRYPHLPWKRQSAEWTLENLRTQRKTPANEYEFKNLSMQQLEFARRAIAQANGETTDETKDETKETESA